jgi:hypothetical protein
MVSKKKFPHPMKLKIEFDLIEERRITPIELEAFVNFFNEIITILKEPLDLDFHCIDLIKSFSKKELMILRLSQSTNSPIYPEKLYSMIEKFFTDIDGSIFTKPLNNLYRVIYKDIVRQDKISEILNDYN